MRSTALAATLPALLLMALGGVRAQTEPTGYTVIASVIFARTGERTTVLGGDPIVLTPYGAQQMYSLGSFFRGRYIGTGAAATPGEEQVAGLASFELDSDQLQVLADDAETTAISAQAFMQAFYPPYALTADTAEFNVPASVMANNSFLDYPMGGYQYPVVETLSEYDPSSIFIAGTEECLNWDISSGAYTNSEEFLALANASLPLYQIVGNAILPGLLDYSDWSLSNGYWIFDYLTYLNRHNSTINQMLSDTGPFPGTLSEITALANRKEWSIYGDLTVSGAVPGDRILAVAGRTLAAKVLEQFFSNLNSLSLTNKVTLMVGEFQPMLSLISLLGLGDLNDRFQEIPQYGSAIVFELFTFNTSVDAGVDPDPADLWVRFLFRNGSDVSSSDFAAVNPPIQAYPMFGRGPDGTNMAWSDFEEAMTNILLGNIEDWCTVCMASTIFCAAFLDNSNSGSSSPSKKHISPAVGGVIGAIVTLAVLGAAAGLLIFFGGLRFHRRDKSQLGGFKGSAKLASDTDLALPNAAPVGISIDDKKGHERVGSWELKGSQKEVEVGGGAAAAAAAGVPQHERYASLGSTIVNDRLSFEADDFGIHSTPVKPRESL